MKILIVHNKLKDFNNKILDRLCAACVSEDITYYIQDINKFSPNVKDDYTCIITIGGDGTVLSVLNSMNGLEIPVIGINVGRVGYLAEIEIDDIEKAIRNIKKHKVYVRKHYYIEGVIKGTTERYVAVNDILIGKSNFLSTVSLELIINGITVNKYICDGFNVSSALGTTAYNKVLGGPVIYHSSPVMALSPIGTADNLFKSLVIPDNSLIEIKVLRCNEGEHCVVGFDSRNILNLEKNASVIIRKSEKSFKILHLEGHNYYKNLQKLRISENS